MPGPILNTWQESVQQSQHSRRVLPAYSMLDPESQSAELGFQPGSRVSELAPQLGPCAGPACDVACRATSWLYMLHTNSTASPQMRRLNASPHTAERPWRGGTYCPSQEPLLSLRCPRIHFELLWVTRSCVSQKLRLTQSVCQGRTAQCPSNLGHPQRVATETLCRPRPHITYQSVSPKTCCPPRPCPWGHGDAMVMASHSRGGCWSLKWEWWGLWILSWRGLGWEVSTVWEHSWLWLGANSPRFLSILASLGSRSISTHPLTLQPPLLLLLTIRCHPGVWTHPDLSSRSEVLVWGWMTGPRHTGCREELKHVAPGKGSERPLQRMWRWGGGEGSA